MDRNKYIAWTPDQQPQQRLYLVVDLPDTARNHSRGTITQNCVWIIRPKRNCLLNIDQNKCPGQNSI